MKFRKKVWAAFLSLALIWGIVPVISAANTVNVSHNSYIQAEILFDGVNEADLGDLILQLGRLSFNSDFINFAGCDITNRDDSAFVTSNVATAGVVDSEALFLTKREITNSKITLKMVVTKGAAAINGMQFVYDRVDGHGDEEFAQVQLRLNDRLKSTNIDGVDFEARIFLVVNGRQWADSRVVLTGNLRNDSLLYTYDGGDNRLVYIGDGIILIPNGNYTNIELDVGEGVSVFSNIIENQQYWATAYVDYANNQVGGDVDDGDDEDSESSEDSESPERILMRKYGISTVYHINQVLVASAANYVKLNNEDPNLYVYDGRLRYIGKAGDNIPFAETYYLSANPIVLKENTSSSAGSSSSQKYNSNPAPSNTPAPVTQSNAVSETQKALSAARQSGSAAVVNLKNASDISLNTMQAVTKTAGGNSVKLSADSMNGRAVDVRITLDPGLATKNINLSASTTSQAAKKTEATFKKYFDNNVSVVSLSQKGDFGMPVEIAAKIGNSLNVATLAFYSYDNTTNSFKQITNAKYWLDKNGYVHFTTTFAGDIVIADKPLAKK